MISVQGSRLYLNLKGFIVGLAMPSLSAMECHVNLPSGATMTMISRDELHLNWRNERSSFASWGSGEETMNNTFSRRGKEDESFIRSLECNKFEDTDKLEYHSSNKARIPSIVFEPVEFEGFVPEVISLSELESASMVARGDHIDDMDHSEAQSASDSSRSRTALRAPVQNRSLTVPPASPGYMGRSANSVQAQRPHFSSASSDLVIQSNGSSA